MARTLGVFGVQTLSPDEWGTLGIDRKWMEWARGRSFRVGTKWFRTPATPPTPSVVRWTPLKQCRALFQQWQWLWTTPNEL